MVVDYCKKLLIELERLDFVIFQIESLKNDLEDQIERRINRQSILLSAILSISLMVWYTSKISGLFDNRVAKITEIESFIQMFSLSFLAWGLGLVFTLFFKIVWEKDLLPGGRKTTFKHLLPRYVKKQQEISKSTQEILKNDFLKYPKIDAKYLTTASLTYILEILKAGTAHSLDEATRLVELESRDPKVRQLLIPNENTLEQAQAAIQEDLKKDLIKKKSISGVILNSFK